MTVTQLPSVGADSPYNRSTFRDGRLIRNSPPRHARVHPSLGVAKKHAIPSISMSSTSKHMRSDDKTPKAVTNRGTKKSARAVAPAAAASSRSLLLQRAYESMAQPKQIEHVPRISFGDIPESLDCLNPAPSLETMGSLDLMFSTSSDEDGADYSDGISAAASMMSTASIASALTMSTSGKNPSAKSNHAGSKQLSSFDSKIRRLSKRRGRTIDNLDGNQSNEESLQKKATFGDASTALTVTDAASILSGLSNIKGDTTQDVVSLLTNAINVGVAATTNLREELERLKQLSIQPSLGEKKSSNYKGYSVGTTGRGVGTDRGRPITRSNMSRSSNATKQEKPVVAKASTTTPVSTMTFRGRSLSRTKSRSGTTSNSTKSSDNVNQSIKAATQVSTMTSTRGRYLSLIKEISGTTSNSTAVSDSRNPSTKATTPSSAMTFRGRSLSRPKSRSGATSSSTTNLREELERLKKMSIQPSLVEKKSSNYKGYSVGTTGRGVGTDRGRPITRSNMSRSSNATKQGKPVVAKASTTTPVSTMTFRGRSLSRTKSRSWATSNSTKSSDDVNQSIKAATLVSTMTSTRGRSLSLTKEISGTTSNSTTSRDNFNPSTKATTPSSTMTFRGRSLSRTKSRSGATSNYTTAGGDANMSTSALSPLRRHNSTRIASREPLMQYPHFPLSELKPNDGVRKDSTVALTRAERRKKRCSRPLSLTRPSPATPSSSALKSSLSNTASGAIASTKRGFAGSTNGCSALITKLSPPLKTKISHRRRSPSVSRN